MTSTRRPQRYERARLGVERWQRFERGLFDGLALGFLDDVTLDEIDANYYNRSQQYHQHEFNLGGLRSWETHLARNHLPSPSDVVVIGAGGGREVLGLSRLGHNVTGFECNERLVEAGTLLLADHGKGASLAAMERSRLPTLDSQVDVIWIGWGVYSLVRTQTQRIALLTESAAATGCRGSTVMSFLLRDDSAGYFGVVHAVSSAVRKLRRRPSTSRGDCLEPNFIHAFTIDEVGFECEAAGMDIASWSFANDPAGPYAWVVARPGAARKQEKSDRTRALPARGNHDH